MQVPNLASRLNSSETWLLDHRHHLLVSSLSTTSNQVVIMAQNAAAENAAKKQIKQMKKGISALQQRAMQAEEAQQRAEEENQALKMQLNRCTGPNANNAEGHATNRSKLTSSETFPADRTINDAPHASRMGSDSSHSGTN
ncbi:hypothetical protein ACGC1H_002021 [Rhizoctonia solani]